MVLLRSKIHLPAVRPRQVVRPQLMARLDAGLAGKLTLVSAPAGYGKTTTVATWLKARSLPAAWLSLEAEDNQPGRFWAYFIAALQTLEDSLGEKLLSMLRSAPVSPTEAFLSELVNEMRAIQTRFVFVLDDFHVIEAQQIQAGMLFVLDYLPPAMHLVVSSRADPPWPLARLRGQAQITELRIEDLRLTLEESAEFLRSVMELDLLPEQVAALDGRTDGWITGLQLAGLSLQGRQDKWGFINTLTGSQQFILDYLVEEVLDRQPAYIQDFLLQTSIVERMTAPLCDAITSRQDSRDLLVRLERSNLFLLPVDDERRWFRYHRLFADLLRSRLQQKYPEQVSEVHRRASLWYADYGMLSEAVRHAFQAGDIELAARLIEQNALAVITVYSEPLSTLTGWLEALPEPVFRSRPWLAVARTWVLAYSGELAAAEAAFQDLEQAIHQAPAEGDPEHLEGSLAAIRGYCAFMAGDGLQGVYRMEQALARLPQEDAPTRVFCSIVLGSTMGLQGDLAGGIGVLAEALACWRSAPQPLLPIMILCESAGLLLLKGELTQVVSACEQAIQQSSQYAGLIGLEPPVVSFAHARLCYVLREQNDLEAAIRHGQQAVQIARDWGQKDSLCISQTYLGLALQAAGRWEEARQALQTARQISADISRSVDDNTAAFEARLHAMHGNMAFFTGWVEASGLKIEAPLPFSRLREALSLARVLMTGGKPDQCLAWIARSLPIAESSGAKLYAIEMLVLQAMAWDARNNLGQALLSLEKALRMAEPEGYVRVFVDEGHKMGELLQHVSGRGIAVRYVRHLLAALEASTRLQAEKHAGVSEYLLAGAGDPLTPREREILKMLMTSRSVENIADELCITVNTLRTHIRNIFDKLHVHSRMEAVSWAREMNLH